MIEQSIPRLLGKLQDDPGNEATWKDLQAAAGEIDRANTEWVESIMETLSTARVAHEERQEMDAVARLLEFEAQIARNTPKEPALLEQLATIQNEKLDQPKKAVANLWRLIELSPDNASWATKIEEIEEEEKHWQEMVAEAQSTADTLEEKPHAQAGMLYSAAQIAYRYGLSGNAESDTQTKALIIEQLEEALSLAKDHVEIASMLERFYSAEGRWSDVVRVLDILTNEGEAHSRVAALLRLARVHQNQLNDADSARAAYVRVLGLVPGHETATGAIVEHLSSTQNWDQLVFFYDDLLRQKLRPGREFELQLQIAMVHWKMRNRPDEAESFFERVRRVEPANSAMITFFREVLHTRGDIGRLATVLADALKVSEGAERQALSAEVARLSEESQGAGKAIEHWKTVFKNDPSNSEARESLRRLYYRTEAWPPLIELIRQQIDRLPAGSTERVPLLKELVKLHHEKTKQDAALVPVLQQILAIEPNDLDAAREQVRVFEVLNRPRDLVTAQARLAELEPSPTARVELWRVVARQWLEKFSNMQNALEAFEKITEISPDDEEALSRLRELYAKRRAYGPLYDLLARIRMTAGGPERVEIGLEMAKLAAERLERGKDAIALYWQILEEDPNATHVVELVEKQAEREKDFEALARALRFRIDHASDDDSKLKLLEKLGALYERLANHADVVNTWRETLVLKPGYPKALRILREELLAHSDYDALTEVYLEQNDYEGLAEALTGAADRATDPELKVSLSWRVAEVYKDKIGRPERAARSYERILAVLPQDVEAARALAPILELESMWARLPSVYDVLLRAATDDNTRAEILEKLRVLATGPLADKEAAFTYAQRIYELNPNEETRRQLESSARAANAYAGYVDALTKRLTKLPREAAIERRQLGWLVAECLAHDIGNRDQAVARLWAMVKEDAEDVAASQLLYRYLRELNAIADLRTLFELRIARADAPTQVTLLLEWATLEEDTFGQARRALDLYAKALSLDPKNRHIFGSIARLHLLFDQPEAAVVALEQERDLLAGEERAEADLKLAKLYFDRLDRTQDALEAAQRTLEAIAHQPDAIAVLEAIFEKSPEFSVAAARTLAAEYDAIGAHDRHVRVIEKLIAEGKDPEERRALFDRLIEVHQSSRNDANAAFEAALRAVTETPSELNLWDRLTELGAHISRLREVAEAISSVVFAQTPLPSEVEMELCDRASALLEDKLSEPDRAIPYLEQILRRHPTDGRAFARLKQIFTTGERWNELQTLYDRTIAVTEDHERAVDMLSEVALVFEEILDDPTRAMASYERVLALDPANVLAGSALDKLYQRTEKWVQLAKLLETRLDQETNDESIRDLETRLAYIHLDRIGDHASALKFAARLFERNLHDSDARTVARKVIDTSKDPIARVRAAQLLEAVYLDRDEPRELDEVTQIQLDQDSTLTGDRRVELLRRLASLRNERLANDVGAIAALAELVPLVPDDDEARANLLEIGRRSNTNAKVAEVLAFAAENATSPELKGRILVDQASVFEHVLHDDSKAEAVYRKIIELHQSDSEIGRSALESSLQALERLYVGQSNHAQLAEILRLQVRSEDDSTVRRTLLGRLGALLEGPLHDRKGAIDSFKQRLVADDADEEALEALDRLYLADEQYPELVEILSRREQLASEGTVRKTLLRRLGEVYADNLKNTQSAIEAYRRLLDDFGPETSVLTALEKLYLEAGDYSLLASMFEQHLDLQLETRERVAVFSQLGDVRADHLKDLSGALNAYREALTLDPNHQPTRSALEKQLSVDEAKEEAARLLRPLYEAENKHDKLLVVLEIQASASSDSEEQLTLLEKAISVCETGLSNLPHAFDLVRRALLIAAHTDHVKQWVERAISIASACNMHAELVTLLAEVEHELYDDQAKLLVLIKMAETCRDQLNDRASAETHFVAALAVRPEDRHVLVSLSALYEAGAEYDKLVDILKRRIEIENVPEQRRELLTLAARVYEEHLQNLPGAVECLQQIVDSESPPPAFAVTRLETLFGKTDRWNDVVDLLEHQIGQEWQTRDDIELRYSIGKICFEHLDDHDRGFNELRTALAVRYTHKASIETLETMLKDETHRAEAAEILEAVYQQRDDWKSVLNTLEVRLLDCQDPDDRRALLTRIANMHEDEGKDPPQAIATYARILQESIDFEEAWENITRIAKAANLRDRELAIYETELAKHPTDDDVTTKLAIRAGAVAREIKENERALALYHRAHSYDGASRETFDAIDAILVDLGGRDQERVDLYRKALEHRFEPQDRVALLRKIAEIECDTLKDRERAIASYRELLEVEERDSKALDALEKLLSQTEKWRELADLYERRADLESTPDRVAHFKLQLGNVLDQKLGQAAAAIDCFEQIVGDNPRHTGAISALESMLSREDLKLRVADILKPLYETLDDWKHLISLAEERVAITSDISERTQILLEMAELWEKRANEPKKAFDAISRAWALDPLDSHLRSEADRLAALLGDWDSLVSIYEKVTAMVDDADKGELLLGLAELHDRRRDDVRRALQTLARLAKLDSGNLDIGDRMDSFATMLGDWIELDSILVSKAATADDTSLQALTFRRLGALRNQVLEDAKGAVTAFEKAHELDSSDTYTLDALIALYEAQGNALRLIELYQSRVDVADSNENTLKFELLMKRAKCADADLKQPSEAIESLRAALDLVPNDRDASRMLERLYDAEHRWEDLLEALRTRASIAADSAERVSVRKQMGALLATNLHQPEDSLEVYRLVLDELGADNEAIDAIKELAKEETLRTSVCDCLEPVLRKASRFDDLVWLLELRTVTQEDPAERAATLKALAKTHEEGRKNVTEARKAVLRAFHETPADTELRKESERLAQLEEGTEGMLAFAAALEARAGDVFDPELARDLLITQSRVAREFLKDDLQAAHSLERATELAGDSPELLALLVPLYEHLKDDAKLARVLERQLEVVTDGIERATIRVRLAKHRSPKDSFELLRVALEESPDSDLAREGLENLLDDKDLFDEVAEVLDGVYRTRKTPKLLAKLFEKRIEKASDSDRIRYRLELARVLEEDCKEPSSALTQITLALEEEPLNSEVFSEFERLLPLTNAWADAASVLEKILESPKHTLGHDLQRDWWTKVATIRQEKLSDESAAEKAYEKALSHDPENIELLLVIEKLRRKPGRERELVATLSQRSALAFDADEKLKLRKEAHALALKPLEDNALAEKVVRAALAEDESNTWAIEQLIELRKQAKDFREVLALLLKLADLTQDISAANALRHQAAKVASDELRDDAKAIDLYRGLLDNSDGGVGDLEAANQLKALFVKTKKLKDLAELLQRQIDGANSPDVRNSLRLELADVQRVHLKDQASAISTLQAILEEDRAHRQAFDLLTQLFESQSKFLELTELLNAQIELAHEQKQIEREIELRLRAGDLFHARLKDLESASATFEKVLELDARSIAALTALVKLCEQAKDTQKGADFLARLVDLKTGKEGADLALKLAGMVRDDCARREAALRKALDYALADDAAAVVATTTKELRELLTQTSKWKELAELIESEAKRATENAAKAALLREAADVHFTKRDDAVEASRLLEEATKLLPEDRVLLLALCDAFTKAGRTQDAAAVIKRIIESYGNKRPKEVAVYHHRLAIVYEAENQIDQALGELEQARKVDPSNVPSIRDYGKLLLKVGKLDEAQRNFQTLLLQNSGKVKGEAYFYLGELNFQKGDKNKALQMYERAFEFDNTLTTAKEKVVELKAALGKKK